jgi:hypothetical protein
LITTEADIAATPEKKAGSPSAADGEDYDDDY